MKRRIFYLSICMVLSGNNYAMEKDNSNELMCEWDTGSAITAIAYSTDCLRIATGHHDSVCLWNSVNGQKIKKYSCNFQVHSLKYDELKKEFIIFFQPPNGIEIIEGDVTELIGSHAPDGRTTAVGDHKGRMRIYKGPLFCLLEAAKKVDLSQEQWQLLYKLEQNHGAPVDLTEEEKAIFDSFTLLHSFLAPGLNMQEKRPAAIIPAESSLSSKNRWPMLGYLFVLLSDNLRSFFPLKHQGANPIAHS